MKKVSELKVGTKIIFGTFPTDSGELERIPWIKAHGDNAFVSEFALCQRAFDATEDVRRNGNSRFFVSNIEQWANAIGTGWFKKQHETDRPPVSEYLWSRCGGYDDKPGFLSYFEEYELSATIPSELVAKDLSNGSEERGESRVFLPSLDELKDWDLFAKLGCTTAAVSIDTGERVDYWVRDNRGPGSSVYVRRNGELSYNLTYTPNYQRPWFRPAVRLAADTELFGPDENGCYLLTVPIDESIDITDEDLELLLTN